jgi:hypothetical protein
MKEQFQARMLRIHFTEADKWQGEPCGGSVCSDRFFGLLSGKIVQLVVVVAVGM